VMSSSSTDSEIAQEEQPNERLSTPKLATPEHLLEKSVLIEDVGDIGQHSGVSSLSLGKVVLIEVVGDIGQDSGVSSLSLGKIVLIEDVGDIGQHSGVSSLSLGQFVLIEDVGDIGQHSSVSSLSRRPQQDSSNSRCVQKSF